MLDQWVSARVVSLTEKVLDGLAAPRLRVTARVRVNTMGPHRSQFRRAALCWLRSLKGNTTSTRLRQMRSKSRFTVSHTGSSRVLLTLPKPEEPSGAGAARGCW